MKQYLKVEFFAILVIAVVFLVACGSSGEDKARSDSGSSTKELRQDKHHLLLAAAASLETVMEKEIIPAFEKEHPDVMIEGSYDSSGKLQTQIEKGLEADFFFSAATKQMQELVKQNLVEKNTVIPLLQNKLVMIVPSSTKEKWQSFEDLTKADMIALGDPASVPAGQYAEKALKKLGSWDYVEAHASLGTNVTEVLNWVAEGSASVGIVYATDAKGNDKVQVVAELPADVLEEPIIYPVAPLKNSKEKEIADDFLAFLQSKEVASYFENVGFTLNK